MPSSYAGPNRVARLVTRLAALTAVAALAASAAGAPGAGAFPGDLDTSFGTAGRVRTAFPTGGAGAAYIAVEPDGDFVAAGVAAASTGGNPTFALARYHSDGSLDASFGTNGQVVTNVVEPGSGHFAGASAVVVQPDGKIVAGGQADLTPAATFGVIRYNVDGSLDSSFGTGGVATPGAGAEGGAGLIALALQPDGKLVAVGYNATRNFIVYRLNPDGSLDTTWGGSGGVLTGFGGASTAETVVLQPDGKVVVAGGAQLPSGNGFALARYNPDGTLDATFGNHGQVFTSGLGTVTAMAVRPDGKIVVAGSGTYDPTLQNPALALARYNPDGSLDTGFGNQGTTVTANVVTAGSLAREPGGQIIVTGSLLAGNTSTAVVERFTAAGALDTTFGNSGRVLIGGGFIDAGAAVYQSDGTLTVAGGATIKGTSEFALARLEPDSTSPPADLTLSQSGPSSPPTINNPLTYTLTISNHGPGTAQATTLDGSLRGPGNFTWASSSQGTCQLQWANSGGGTIHCDLGSLASDGAATMAITVNPTAAGTFTSTATTSSAIVDPNPADNTSTTTFTVAEDPSSGGPSSGNAAAPGTPAPSTPAPSSSNPQPPSTTAPPPKGASPTTTTLTASLNPSTKNQAVTFTATVMTEGTLPAGRSSAPTGSVSFFDGSKLQCKATLHRGVATCTSKKLKPGSHSIVASFAGKKNTYTPSRSSVLTQTVK